MKVQIVDDVNDTSAHDVQDNGEDYNEVWYNYELKMKCTLRSEVKLSYFEVLLYYKYMNVQMFKNIQKC